MKNSYKKLFGSLLMLWALSLSGCHQPDAEIDTLDYSRALQPLNFAAVVDRETGYDVNFMKDPSMIVTKKMAFEIQKRMEAYKANKKKGK